MNRLRKRTVYAWLLLSVFLLTTMVSALHTHQPTAQSASDCADCAHNVQHHSHLTPDAESLHDCVLCQFLSLVYTVAATLTISLLVSLHHQGRSFLQTRVIRQEPSLLTTRGPPAIL